MAETVKKDKDKGVVIQNPQPDPTPAPADTTTPDSESTVNVKARLFADIFRASIPAIPSPPPPVSISPPWQEPILEKARNVHRIVRKLLNLIKESSEQMNVSALKKSGETIPKLSALLYFLGLLTRELDPVAYTDVRTTFLQIESSFRVPQLAILELLKTLKEIPILIEAVSKPLLKEIGKTFPELLDTETTAATDVEIEVNNPEEVAEAASLKKSKSSGAESSTSESLSSILGLVNHEMKKLSILCPDIAKDGEPIRITTTQLSLENQLNVWHMVEGEILQILNSSNEPLYKIEYSKENEWKDLATGLGVDIKRGRTENNLGAENCSPELYLILKDLNRKLKVGIPDKVLGIRNAAVQILKDIESVRRQASNWAPANEIETSPLILKKIRASKKTVWTRLAIPFCAPPIPDAMAYEKNFEGLGADVGENFMLEIPMSRRRRAIIFGNDWKGNDSRE